MFGSLNLKLFLAPPIFDQDDVTVVIRNELDVCVLWQKERGHSIYHEVKVILLLGQDKIDQKVSNQFEEKVRKLGEGLSVHEQQANPNDNYAKTIDSETIVFPFETKAGNHKF